MTVTGSYHYIPCLFIMDYAYSYYSATSSPHFDRFDNEDNDLKL